MIFTIGVVVVGKALLKMKIAKEETLAAQGGNGEADGTCSPEGGTAQEKSAANEEER